MVRQHLPAPQIIVQLKKSPPQNWQEKKTKWMNWLIKRRVRENQIKTLSTTWNNNSSMTWCYNGFQTWIINDYINIFGSVGSEFAFFRQNRLFAVSYDLLMLLERHQRIASIIVKKYAKLFITSYAVPFLCQRAKRPPHELTHTHTGVGRTSIWWWHCRLH